MHHDTFVKASTKHRETNCTDALDPSVRGLKFRCEGNANISHYHWAPVHQLARRLASVFRTEACLSSFIRELNWGTATPASLQVCHLANTREPQAIFCNQKSRVSGVGEESRKNWQIVMTKMLFSFSWSRHRHCMTWWGRNNARKLPINFVITLGFSGRVTVSC